MSAFHPRIKAFLLTGIIATLAACGGDGGSDNPPPPPPEPDTTPATATFTPEGPDLGIRENIVVAFNEPVDPDTLDLSGLLWDLAANPDWNDDNTELTLSPNEQTPGEGAWESGVQAITGTVEDLAGNTTNLDMEFEIRLEFETFQAASVVIGQTDFESSDPNQGGNVNSNTLDSPLGKVSLSNNRLWVTDTGSNRVLGFDGVPEVGNNGVGATWIVGQPDSTSNGSGLSDSDLDFPATSVEYQDRFYTVDFDNNRVLIFDSIPLSEPAAADNVIGQPDLNSNAPRCLENSLDSPFDIQIADDKLIVSDYDNHRVLIWNTVPANADGVPADLVLGQDSMTTCLRNDDNQEGSGDVNPSRRTFEFPSGVWSDGERLAVVDGGNNRVLIWNTFPDSSFEPADLVLGQPNFTSGDKNVGGSPGAATLAFDESASGVWSNGLQLAVTDSGNSRVLIWNTFPTQNFEPADIVIGQENGTTITNAGASATSLSTPFGINGHRDRLFVTDYGFHRVLVFEAQ